MNTTVQSRSPQRPSDLVAELPETTAIQTAAIVDTARSAQRGWAAAPPADRSESLRQMADAIARAAGELATLIAREVGKPVSEAEVEVARAVAILRYYSQQAFDPDGETYPGSDGRSLMLTRRRPLGVAGLITPFNFPLAIPVWKAAPALAYGNAAVLKPSPQAVAVGTRLHELTVGCLPPGVFSVVVGKPAQAIVDLVDCISFTGSSRVGSMIREKGTNRNTPVQCEMGGKNASVILPDADLDKAALAVAMAAMGYAGQKCTATSRAIVVGDSRAFVDALVAAVATLRVGNPMDSDVQLGPVIDDAAAGTVLSATAEAVTQGGQVLTGGTALDHEGHFVAPTVITGVPADSRINQEEVFGPFCTVIPASSIQEAVTITNGVRFGIVAAVFTHDLHAALTMTRELEVGLTRVNVPTTGVDFYAPFGGMKQSSYGPREQGKAARDFFTGIQTVTIAALGPP